MLVERIIHKIVDEKIDIDHLLVVTFTNAAASEMRARILEAIYKYLEQNPEDKRMQKQILLMSKAYICTIHSFCLDVIRNHFYEIGISPNFRIAEQTEIILLKEEVLEELFEEKYEAEDKEFLNLLDTYTTYLKEDVLKELILKIERDISANPFPNEWLEEKVQEFKIKSNTDFSETVWGKVLLSYLEEEICSCILELKSVKNDIDKFMELDKFSLTLQSDINKLEELKNNLDSWDKAYKIANDIKWDTWPRDSKNVIEAKEIAKEKRDEIKKKFTKVVNKILLYTSNEAISDMQYMYNIIEALKNIVFEFKEKFALKKQEKNIIDFNDIEHFALRILVEKNENGEKIPTSVAKEYSRKFEEIAIDEYQDSNLVQEYILNVISRGNNIFMVGDIKQSIYKFRQARPELFLNKYETYKLKKEKNKEDSLKIQLFKNFRSRENILKFTNQVFESIMTKELGDVSYNEDEYLNLGSNYAPLENCEQSNNIELDIIDTKEQAEIEETDEEENEISDNSVLEAKFVAKRIQDLINSGFKVYDKKQEEYRNVTYKDIVILLRSTLNLAPIYEKELTNLEIPVFSDANTQYLETMEIQTILALLKVIDNPLQDIPLVTVLRSVIGGFSDNELIEIKLNGGKKATFYEKVQEALINEQTSESIKEKISKFLMEIDNWRKENEYLPLNELIWKIYMDTGFYNYVSLMPNGAIRQANLKLLFEKAKDYEKASFQGLFHFIRFIDELRVSNSDMDSAKIIGENENVVRIMSIHKSKGLEFPVAILTSTSKKFNLRDVASPILINQDLGFGIQFIDCERKIQYPTLTKLALAQKITIETLSEEMRILYVALTRAKEKLIITGLEKDLQKSFSKKEDILKRYNEEKIHPNILKRYHSYLDWIELVFLHNKQKMEEYIDEKIYIKEDILKKEDIKEEEEIQKFEDICNEYEENEAITEMLNWSYKNKEASLIQGKTSVSRIKELSKENSEYLSRNEINKEEYKHEKKIPKFLKEEEVVSSARKGSIVHLCLQHLNEKEDYNIEKIEFLKHKLVEKGFITPKESDSVSLNDILKYTKSNLFSELKEAKEVRKEQAFYTYLTAKEVYGKDVNEKILVQGIIDLYYIDKDDKLKLVDYKTDYVKRKEDLIEKYKKQLEIYKSALEKSQKRKVDSVYIYSIYLQELLELDI